VNETSRAWKEPEPIRGDPMNAPADRVMTLTYEHRALDTDLLEAPAGHVITGVRLRNVGGHVNLEAKITPVKFADGKLIAGSSTWIGNDQTPFSEDPRQPVAITNPDVPVKTTSKSKIDTKHNEYIMFDATAASKDVSSSPMT
jgi:hypothetical protein